MTANLRERVLAAFKLTPEQKQAVLERERDVAVTAGAGSGKTSTLVARYACLLADGFDLRSVVAITFSEKAALEMRARVRETLNKLVREAASDDERQAWASLNAGMDAARIGTIHSLCAEILRAHPVEAGIDPKFTVIDEGLGLALKAQTVQDQMDAMAGQAQYAPLFRILEIDPLAELLAFLLDKRLEAQEAFEKDPDYTRLICQEIGAFLDDPDVAGALAELRSLSPQAIDTDAGDKLAARVVELLALWGKAEKALARGEAVDCALALFQARQENLAGTIGKNGSVKAAIKALREAYDEKINNLCGGKDAQSPPVDKEAEANFALVYALLKPAFGQMLAAYRKALQQLSALDFDDLEDGAARLLEQPEIRKQWQSGIAALLVDEFQDTNERQRRIVLNLAGARGKLFVVGDPKQSIYRFRRADVTVFKSIQERVRAEGGLPLELNITFRAHASLLNGMGDLLQKTMGCEADPARPYYVPFSPLVAERKAPEPPFCQPHIEFVLGLGEEAESARPNAARALAQRLVELKKAGQINSWDEVTLLFRAATGFPAYEAAFEQANIPFVTVAGRGFYDRPEIRDVLNILRALVDPSDDLAMAGLLRSPAFGLTDTALYQLRWQAETPAHYWSALQGELSLLDSPDRLQAARTVAILKAVLPLVDRIPVAELLKKVVDATDYRALLAAGDQAGNGGRLWRNLDKLMVDAQASGKVNVRDFLDYLTSLNAAGAREGEAAGQAQGSVRLMTIHKAKGLQFPLVVLADASREPRAGSQAAILLPELGLAFRLDPAPMLYRLAKQQDQRQEQAEKQRLLYVALTRAQEKLIINGHLTTRKNGGVTCAGYLSDLVGAAGLELEALVDQAGSVQICLTCSGEQVRAWVLPDQAEVLKLEAVPAVAIAPEPESVPLYPPLELPPEPETDAIETGVRRAPVAVGAMSPVLIGKLVHKAIELWLFPGDPRLTPLLETTALNSNLAQKTQVPAAVQAASELLSRLENHPLRREVEGCPRRFHELPYSRLVNGRAETGYIDLMYLSPAGWQILDFKTDSIRSAQESEELTRRYMQQMRRYTSAVETLLDQKVRTRICFLDDHGEVELVEV